MSVSLNSFHNAKPMHMHPACENCRQPSRLLRCGKCHIARYCSKECQSRDWRIHKRDCKDWQHLCDDSKSASGNPSAWLDFAKWMEYHDDSILNAALAYFISKGPGSEDNYALCLFLIYDSEAPLVERKFQVHDAQFIHKDLPDTPYIPQAVIKAALEPHDPTPHNLWQSRLGLITTGPVRKGTCIFVPSWSATGGSGLFYRSFNMTEKQLSADVNAYMHPRRMLMKMFELGQKYRICCGDIRETSTCCCGGWTHEDDAVELFPFKSLNDVKGESLEKLGHFEAAATPSHEELLIGQEEQQEAPQSPKEVKSKKKKPKSKKKKHGDKVIDSDPRSSELDPRARDSEDNVEHSLQTPREAQSTASAIDAETGQNSDASDRRTTAAAASAASEEPEVIDSERCSHVTMNADSGVVTGVTSDAQDCTQYGAQLGTLQESSPTWSRHDIRSVLVETRSDVKLAAFRIGEEDSTEWVPVKSKKPKQPTKDRPQSSNSSSARPRVPNGRSTISRKLSNEEANEPTRTVASTPRNVAVPGRSLSVAQKHSAPRKAKTPVRSDGLEVTPRSERKRPTFAYGRGTPPSASAPAAASEPSTTTKQVPAPMTKSRRGVSKQQSSPLLQQPTYSQSNARVSLSRTPAQSSYRTTQHSPHLIHSSPAGMVVHQVPAPYFNPYAAQPQASFGHYPYAAAQNTYVGVIPSPNSVIPPFGPYGQSMYTEQAIAAARTLETATRVFNDATRALEDATQEFYRVGHVQHTALNEHTATSAEEQSREREQVQDACAQDEDSSIAPPAHARGRRRRMSAVDVMVRSDQGPSGMRTERVRARSVGHFDYKSWQP